MYVGPLLPLTGWRYTLPLDLGKAADTEGMQGMMEDKVPIIMENVFECTLEMINKDFSEYPEHRVEFFKLLRAINLFCFPGKPNYPPYQGCIFTDRRLSAT
jgi:hypothetical protein